MKVARLKHGKIFEFIPDYATPVEKWYGISFAQECVEVPDSAKIDQVYDGNDWIFQTETPPPTTEERLAALEAATLAMMMGGAADV